MDMMTPNRPYTENAAHATEVTDRAMKGYFEMADRLQAAVAGTGAEALAREMTRAIAAKLSWAYGYWKTAAYELDALTLELEAIRPSRHCQTAAPPLPLHTYVTAVRSPWICAAKSVREVAHISAGLGCDYHQEHWSFEKVTACGRKVLFPENERYTSGGWPRQREVCPECMRKLAAAGQWPRDGDGEGDL